MPTKRIIIKGKVQGVFFRASAKDTADRLGVTGWVRNTAEGDVEALVTGNGNQLDQFIAWCRVGPSRARVNEVVIINETDESFSAFLVKR